MSNEDILTELLTMETEQYVTESRETSLAEFDREMVLKLIADFVKDGDGFLHRVSDKVQHLYLVSGEIYSLNEMEITRVR
jgi:hypothetical protein